MNNSNTNPSGGADGALSPSQNTLDVKQHFVTREGYYKCLPAHEYSRPNRTNNLSATPQNNSQQANVPVLISMVQVPDEETGGFSDRILFNVGKELLFYAFKGVWEVSGSNL
jgi:hypothetical protein